MKNHKVMKWSSYSLLCYIMLVMSSCGGTKPITGGTVNKLTSTKIITNHYKNAFRFNTLNAKVKVVYEDHKQSFSPTVTLRMEKDKTIWMSVRVIGITMAKIWITPEKISYYEKINGTYFEGDFEAVSQWLGVALDFENMQQLLVGEAIFDLKATAYKQTLINQIYQLEPKKQGTLFDLLFLIYPQNFKIASQQLRQPSAQQVLKIDYPEYQKIANQEFPKEILVLAKQKEKTTKIAMTYREVRYNEKVTFPFKIPSGYKQVNIP